MDKIKFPLLNSPIYKKLIEVLNRIIAKERNKILINSLRSHAILAILQRKNEMLVNILLKNTV